MTKIYWDSNLFIYLFEENPRFVGRVREIRTRMIGRGDLLYTGTLTVGEVLVKPVEKRDMKMIGAYRDFFSNTSVIKLVALDIHAAEHYAAIRADRGISHADAIQLACAASAGIDLFITNDERLQGKVIPGIKFLAGLSSTPL